MNLGVKKVIRRLETGGRVSLRHVNDNTVRKALRAVNLGYRPTNRSGDPEVDKQVRKILNRR